MSRLGRERRTMSVMITLYCRDQHGEGTEPRGPVPRSGSTGTRRGQDLCADCEALVAYAERRLDRCRFGQSKPTCARCTVHCFGPAMRERIREVMRYAGPRMMLRHPILALAHLIDSRRGDQTIR